MEDPIRRFTEPERKAFVEAQEKHGTKCLRNGHLDAAQAHFLQALEADPRNAALWFLLGTVALKRNNAATAVTCLNNCLARQADHAEAANYLGIALRKLGRPQDAVAAFRRALASKQRNTAAACNLGAALEALGDDAEAEASYRLALSWDGHVESATRLANLLARQARAADALPYFELAQRLAPRNAFVCGNLALGLLAVGRPGRAKACAQLATSADPGNAFGWRALGLAENSLGDNEAALLALRKAAELAPSDATIAAELATTLLETGDVDEARSLAARATTAEQFGESLRWQIALSLPPVYDSEAQVESERRRFARGLEEIDDGLGLGSAEQRRAAYRAACRASTFLLHYQGHDNTALQSHFGDIVGRVMAATAPQLMQPIGRRSFNNGQRVRVGIVSSHLMHHTVSRYFRRMITALDPGRFEVIVWSGSEVDDFSTKEIASRASRFERYSRDPLATAERIRAEGVDVLIYPEIGMDPRHHVLGALRLAPVQCLMYGHPVTSGLANMDYFIGGAGLEPENGQSHYREKLVLLPGIGASPARPPVLDMDDLPGSGAAEPGILLCLQNHLKISPSFDRTLAAIAAETGRRIGFFFRNTSGGGRFRQRIEEAFRSQGLEPSSTLVFMPKTNHEKFLRTIRDADLILDTPGFSGGATSLDALSVGAPVLAWEGAMARGRQTAAMLRLVDAPELIASNEDDYRASAVALCRDRDLRAELRKRICANLESLFDGQASIDAFSAFVESVARH
jgi:protein O-GlcNAc transferase